MAFIDLNTGITMHYRECGKKDGKTILFIHGYISTLEVWNYQIMALADKYHLIAIDQRGNGDSEKPNTDYSLEEKAADLDAFLEAKDLKDVTIVAWSMGSAVSIYYTSEMNKNKRVKAVIMAAPCAPCYTKKEDCDWGADPQAIAGFVGFLQTHCQDAVTNIYEQCMHRTDMPETKKWLIAGALKAPVYVAIKEMQTMMAYDLRENVKKLDLPVRVLQGRHDIGVDPRYSNWIAENAGGEIVWFEESGHAVMIEESKKFSEEIDRFMTENA